MWNYTKQFRLHPSTSVPLNNKTPPRALGAQHRECTSVESIGVPGCAMVKWRGRGRSWDNGS